MEARCSRDVVLLIRPQYKMSRRPSCFGGRTVRRSVLGDHRLKELLSSASVTGRP
jgi:hypothetical protein